MTDGSDFWLDNPPVWELGLTVQTATPGVMSNYDVRGAHDPFRDSYPKYSRNVAVDLRQQPPFILGFNAPEASDRWWFISDDEQRLIQLQENLIAVNWRRRRMPPEPSAYPGFQATLSRLRETIDALAAVRGSDAPPFPEPLAGELLYDNFLPLIGPGGETLSAYEIFAPVAVKFDPPITDFTTSWREALTQFGTDASLRINLQALVVGAPDEEPGPALRLNFQARCGARPWDDMLAFLDGAHAYVRRRFLDLTTDKAHTMWGLK